MTDKEYKDQVKRIRKIWNKWHDSIGLNWYRVTLEFKRERDEEVPETLGKTTSNWEYRSGYVIFFLPECSRVNDDTLEDAVVHEMTHILVAGIQDMRDDQAREITEYTVTTISRAIIWARKAGYNDNKEKKCPTNPNLKKSTSTPTKRN